jgi:hypothetical protein
VKWNEESMRIVNDGLVLSSGDEQTCLFSELLQFDKTKATEICETLRKLETVEMLCIHDFSHSECRLTLEQIHNQVNLFQLEHKYQISFNPVKSSIKYMSSINSEIIINIMEIRPIFTTCFGQRKFKYHIYKINLQIIPKLLTLQACQYIRQHLDNHKLWVHPEINVAIKIKRDIINNANNLLQPPTLGSVTIPTSCIK